MSDGDDSTPDYSLRIHGRRFSRHGERGRPQIDLHLFSTEPVPDFWSRFGSVAVRD